MRGHLVCLAVLAGCSGDGYVSIRVESTPTSEAPLAAQVGTVGTLDLERSVTSAEVGDQPVNLIASETAGRHLFATVLEVDVKVKPGKNKHGKHKKHAEGPRACHDGVEAGDAHEGPDVEDADDRDERDGDDHESGDKPRHRHWTQLFEGAERVDLFDLGVTAGFLAGGSVPAGQLRAIRLVLADDATFVDGGVTSSVRCPSCSTSGFKIKVHGLRVIPGQSIELSVDLSHSLYRDANGFVLNPVVHLTKVTCDD